MLIISRLFLYKCFMGFRNIPDLFTGNRYPRTGSGGYFGVSGAIKLMCQLSTSYMGASMSQVEGEMSDGTTEVIISVICVCH